MQTHSMFESMYDKPWSWSWCAAVDYKFYDFYYKQDMTVARLPRTNFVSKENLWISLLKKLHRL